MDFSPSPCRPRTPTGVGPTTRVPAPAIWSCWNGCGCNAGRARPAWAAPLPLPPDVTSRQRRQSFRELVAALYVYSVRFRGLSRILALLGYGVAALVVGRHHRLEDTFRLEGAEDFAGGPHDYADTIGKDHGCIEIRGGWTTGDPAYLAPVDPDREECDRARLVGVRMQTPRRRPSHDRCPHLHCQPAPKARPLRQAVRQHRSIENVHHGVWKWPWARTTAAYTRATPPTQDPPQAHGGRLEQGLPVPTDWPQAQTHFDAIVLGTSPVSRQIPSNCCKVARSLRCGEQPAPHVTRTRKDAVP